MKNYIWVDTVREIKKTKSRFGSILVLSALAVCFLAGLRASEPVMKQSADQYFDTQNLMDLHILSPLGLTQADQEAVAQVDGVLQTQASYTIDALATTKTQTMSLKVMSYHGEGAINSPKLLQGSLPTTSNQCLVDATLFAQAGLALGDEMTFDCGDGIYQDGLQHETYEIVGVVQSPLYISQSRGVSSLGNGQVDGFAILPVYNFSLASYTDIYLTVEGAEHELTYDTAYQQLVDRVKDSLTPVAEVQSAQRAEQIVQLATAELQEGKEALVRAEYEIEVALAAALDQIEIAKRELTQGWAEHTQATNELVALGERAPTQTKIMLDEMALALKQGEADLQQGLSDYAKAEQDAQDRIIQAQNQIERAERDLATLSSSSWYVLSRGMNMGYLSYEMDADRMGNLASVFPLIFFLVAALVCLTTMTRMVEEQRVIIGGLKALGYGKLAISVKYVGYGAFASIVGSLLGLALGLVLIPTIIYTAWQSTYQLGEMSLGLFPSQSLPAVGAAVAVVTLSALVAVLSTLTAVPAELMRPKSPPVGKKVFLEKLPFLWEGLTFHNKITYRNLFRYQKRLWMTVIGIGGCTALIVTAFGLRESLYRMVELQYDAIYRHATQISLVQNITTAERREVNLLLTSKEEIGDYYNVYYKPVSVSNQDYTLDVLLYGFESAEDCEQNYFLIWDNQSQSLPEEGVVITQKMAELLGVSVGETIQIDGITTQSAVVSGITQHYTGHNLYLTQAQYQSLFSEEITSNLILANYQNNLSSAESTTLDSALMRLNGVTSLTHLSTERDLYANSLKSVNYAVVVIILCAAVLAFVVLYNLTNINITERMRELATLKVLGFYHHEISDYISRENKILTYLGTALGLLLGKLLHAWLITTVEIDMLMFYRGLRLTSYLCGGALTIFFSKVVNEMAHRTLEDLDMIQSLKSVE